MTQSPQLTPLIKTELLVQTDINREYYNNIVNHQTAIVMLDCMRYVFTESIKKPVLPDIAQKFNICLININMYSPVFFDKYMSLLNNLCFCWRNFIRHQRSSYYKAIKYIIDNWNNNLTEFFNILHPESSLNNLMYIYLENDTTNPCFLKKDIGVIHIKKEYIKMIDRTTEIINSIAFKFEYETKLQFGRLIIDEINKIYCVNQLVINSPEKMNIIKNDTFYSWVKLMFSFANWSISEYTFGLLFELPQQICSFLNLNTQSGTVYSNTLEIIKLFFGGFLPLDAEFNSPSSFIGNLLNFPTKEKILKYELFYKYAQAMNNKIIQLIKMSKYTGLCVIKCSHCKIKGITEQFLFLTTEISCSACGKSFIN